MREILVPAILSGIVGFTIGIILMVIFSKLGLNRDQQKAKLILDEAASKADNTIRQAVLEGKTKAYELTLEAEKEIKVRRSEITELENKLSRREDNLNNRDQSLTQKEKNVEDKQKAISDKYNSIEKMERELQVKVDSQLEVLERIAQMSRNEAKAELM